MTLCAWPTASDSAGKVGFCGRSRHQGRADDALSSGKLDTPQPEPQLSDHDGSSVELRAVARGTCGDRVPRLMAPGHDRVHEYHEPDGHGGDAALGAASWS